MCKWEDIQTRTELEFVLDVIKKKVDSGMAFFFFRCCHGEHRKRCKYCPYYVDIKEVMK